MARRKDGSGCGKDTAYQLITDKIVEQLEQGTVPWRQTWTASGGPQSITGHRYRGINVFLTLSRGFSSPYWLSLRMINERGGKIRQGQSPTYITFWKRIKIRDKVTDEEKIIPMLKWYKVWNLEQVDGINAPIRAEAPTPTPEEPHHAAEGIIAGYKDGPPIREIGDGAYYNPGTDTITLPPRGNFESLEKFYAAAFHEMGHSTGHESRLDRKQSTAFGSHAYGREELIAEMTAAYLCAEAGIEQTIQNSAAYLRSWIRTIREDVRAVVVAAGAAQRAADHILGRTYQNKDDHGDAVGLAARPFLPAP